MNLLLDVSDMLSSASIGLLAQHIKVKRLTYRWASILKQSGGDDIGSAEKIAGKWEAWQHSVFLHLAIHGSPVDRKSDDASRQRFLAQKDLAKACNATYAQVRTFWKQLHCYRLIVLHDGSTEPMHEPVFTRKVDSNFSTAKDGGIFLRLGMSRVSYKIIEKISSGATLNQANVTENNQLLAVRLAEADTKLSEDLRIAPRARLAALKEEESGQMPIVFAETGTGGK